MSEARRYGSYDLVALLGRGGMGEVWRAKHALLDRQAAVKLIRPEMLGQDPERSATLVRRFEREVRATSILRSPHTVTVYDFGVTDRGEFYYAMELLEGLDLRTLVEAHGTVPAERVVSFLLQACDSLAEAHGHGLVHRDVKPANLFVGRIGLQPDFVKVLDFGLVKPAPESSLIETQLTVDGSALGSPAFMPPEMIEGGRPVDARSDVYGLGCVAYWLVTGSLVFEGATAVQMLMRHLQQEPEPPSRRVGVDLPSALEEVILRCLRKRPEDRPKDARELAERLRAVPLAERWTEERAERWWAERRVTPEGPTVAATLTHTPTRRMSQAAAGSPPPGPALPPPVFPPGDARPLQSPAPAPAPLPQEFAPVVRDPEAEAALAAERDRVIAALQEKYVESRIDQREMSRRIERAERAASKGDLDRLLQDLAPPPPPPPPPAAPPVVPPPAVLPLPVVLPMPVPVPAAAPAPPAAEIAAAPTAALAPGPKLAAADVVVDKSRTFLTLFSGRSKTGEWYPSRQIQVVSIFGGTQLDFREALFQPGQTAIDVFASFGGCEIVVPPDLFVNIDGLGILGGFDDSLSREGPPPQGGTPWLRIRGFAFLGGVSVKVLERGRELPAFGPGPGRRRHRRLPPRSENE